MSDSIIFKITTEDMDDLLHYFNLINYSLQKYLGIIYLERIDDGILYICQNLEDFKKLNQSLPPEYHQIIESIKIEKSQDLDVADLIEEKKFPLKGLCFRFTAQNEFSMKNIEIFEQYYRSIHKEIEVKKIDEKTVDVLYSTFSAFRFQINLIYLSIYHTK